MSFDRMWRNVLNKSAFLGLNWNAFLRGYIKTLHTGLFWYYKKAGCWAGELILEALGSQL